MCWSQMAGTTTKKRCFLLAQETSPMKTHGKNRQAMVCCALGCSSSGRGGPEMSCVTPVKGNRIHWVLPIIRIVFKNPKKNITTWVSHEILSWILYKFTVVYFFGGGSQWLCFFCCWGKIMARGYDWGCSFLKIHFFMQKSQCLCFGATKAANKNTPKSRKKQVSRKYFFGGWKVMGIREPNKNAPSILDLVSW